MIHAVPVLRCLAAVAVSIALRRARADRTAMGRRVPALDLAAIAPRHAEARDLLPYLDAAGVAHEPARHPPGGRGVARAGAEVIAIAGHARRRPRLRPGAGASGGDAEIVPLPRSA
jgi:hypothetical protein